MIKNDIYFGTRIWKERPDEDIEKGDVGYVKAKDLVHLTGKVRFLLKDVISWEEWKEIEGEEPFYKDGNIPKTRIYFEVGPTVILLIHIDEFDKVMEEYHSRKGLIKSN